jgi:hypothetical protein
MEQSARDMTSKGAAQHATPALRVLTQPRKGGSSPHHRA